MTHLTKAALGAAVALSVVSIGDAVVRGVSDTPPPWDPEVADTWVIVALSLLEAVTFLLLAAVLVAVGHQVDNGRPACRWVRRALALDLGVLAVAVVLAGRSQDGVFVWIASLGFIAMFLLGVVLGTFLVRRPGLRAAGALMVAPLGLIALAFLLQLLAPGWEHPGYAETALYLGIAMLGLIASPASAEAPAAAGRA